MKYSTYLLWCVACLEYPEQCWHNSRRLLTAGIRQERNKLGQADQGLLVAVTDHSATTRIAVSRSAVPEQILQGQGSHSTLPAVCWRPQVWLTYHASLEYLPQETGYKDTQLSFCCQMSLCGQVSKTPSFPSVVRCLCVVRSARHPSFFFCCQRSLCGQVSKTPFFFLLLSDVFVWSGQQDTLLFSSAVSGLCVVRSARHPAFLLLSDVFVWSGQQDTLLSFCCQRSLCGQVSKTPCFPSVVSGLCVVRSARHPAFLLLSAVFVWSGQQDTLLSFCCQRSLCGQVSKTPCFPSVVSCLCVVRSARHPSFFFCCQLSLCGQVRAAVSCLCVVRSARHPPSAVSFLCVVRSELLSAVFVCGQVSKTPSFCCQSSSLCGQVSKTPCFPGCCQLSLCCRDGEPCSQAELPPHDPDVGQGR